MILSAFFNTIDCNLRARDIALGIAADTGIFLVGSFELAVGSNLQWVVNSSNRA
jgi:hypothetical protein